MINPEDVTHKKYPVDAVVFGTFSIAWGTWDGKQKQIGIRGTLPIPRIPMMLAIQKLLGILCGL